MGYVSSLKDKLLFQRLNTDVSCQLEIPDRTFSEILSLGRSKKNMAGLKQKIYSSQKKKNIWHVDLKSISPSGMFTTNLRFKSDLRSDRTIRMFGTTESRITRVDSGCFFLCQKKSLEVPDQRKNGYKMIH